MKNKTIRIFSVLLCFCLTMTLFASCKKNDDKGSTATSEENKTEEVKTQEENTKPDMLSEALKDGVLTVGTNAAFPPFEYLGDDGKPDGFDMAYIRLLGEKLGVSVEILDMEFESLCASVGSKIDVAIAGMTVDEERAKTVDFTNSYYLAKQYVLVAKDNDEIKDAASLANKRIGAQLGTTGDFIAEEVPGVEEKQYSTFSLAVEDLKNGNLDAVIVDKNPALVFEEQAPDQIKAISGDDFDFEDEYYAIACPKGDTALVEALNKAMSDVQASGEFDQLVKEYIEK